MTALRRVLALALCGLPVVGCLCLVAAAQWYPGGSWWNREAEGASFIDTFLCDMMMVRGLNGTPNPVGSRLAQVGMGLITGSLFPAWWLVGGKEATREASDLALRARHIARCLGLVGVAPLGVALVTAGSWFHAIAIPVAGLVELVALALVTVAALSRPGQRLLGLAGLVLILVVVVGFGFYWPTIWYGELAHRGLPMIQKLGVFSLVIWMLAIARDTTTETEEIC